MNAATTQTRFDQWAQEGHGERMAKGHWPVASQILALLDLQPGQHVLDLGCGNGYVAAWAAEEVGPEGRVVGLDLAPEMIKRAQQTFTAANLRFITGTADTLPFETGSLDRIACIESIYYHADMAQTLRDMYRLLKPGGKVAFMVDYYQENPYCLTWQTEMGIPMTLLSENRYVEMLQQTGFTEVLSKRIMNPTPVDVAAFQPGWGYETPEDVRRFRQEIGSLGLWATKQTITPV